jgi:hypothetical protein
MVILGLDGFLGQETGEEDFEVLASWEPVKLVDVAGFGGPPICLPHNTGSEFVTNSFAH